MTYGFVCRSVSSLTYSSQTSQCTACMEESRMGHKVADKTLNNIESFKSLIYINDQHLFSWHTIAAGSFVHANNTFFIVFLLFYQPWQLEMG